MKLRLRRSVLWLIGLAVVLGTVFLFREAIGWLVLRQVVVALARNSKAKITYARTSGDVYTNPRFHDVLITAGTDSITATLVTVRWQLLPLVRGRLVLSEVRIVDPIVKISGAGAAHGERTAVRSFPNLEIGRLEVVDGMLCLRWDGDSGRFPSVRLESLDMSLALRSQRDEMSISLFDLSTRLGFLSGDSFAKIIAVFGVSGEFLVTADSISAARFCLQTGASYVRGAARIQRRPLGFGFEVEQLSVSLAEVSRLGKLFWGGPERGYPAGRFCATGTCHVDSFSTLANMDYTADSLEVVGVRLPRLSGSLGLLDSLVQLQVSGADAALGALKAGLSFDMRSHRIGGVVAVEGLAVQRFEPKWADFRMDVLLELSGVLGSLAGDTVASTDGGATDSLAVSVAGKVVGLGVDTLSADFTYKDGVAEFRRLRVLGDVGRLEFSGTVRRDQLVAEFRLERFDLGLLGRFADSIGWRQEAGALAGRVSGTLAVVGRADSWSFAGLLFGDSVRMGSVMAGRCVADIVLTAGDGFAGRVALGAEDAHVGETDITSAQFVWTGPEFDLRIERAGIRLQAAGVLDLGRQGFICEVDRAELVSESDTLSTRPFTVSVRGDTLELDSFRVSIADGSIELSGWSCIVAGGGSYFMARGHRLNLRKLQKLLEIPVELWGTVDFTLRGHDTLSFSLAASDFELPAVELRLKRLELDGVLAQKSVWLRSLWFVHQLDTSYVAGDIRLATAFDTKQAFGRTGVQGVTVSGFDLKIDLADPGIWVFSFLRGIVDLRSGLVYGTLRATGNNERLELAGRARVVEATLQVPAVNALVERVNAELTFVDNRVVLDKLTGEAGSGTVVCSGTAHISQMLTADSVGYSLRCENVSINPFPNVYALGSAEVMIGWGTGGAVELTGDIRIDDAVVAVGFGSSAVESSSPGDDSLVYDLRIRADRGVWLRNREADIELGMDLQLRRTMREQIYTGRLWSRQGNLYYLDHTLRVTHGEINFSNISQLDPDILIVAELPVRRSRHLQPNSYPERIILTVSGTLQQPSFALASSPAVWDETQIASYLSLSVPADELGVMGQKEAVTRMLSGRLLDYFQTQVTKKLRDFVALDYLELESGLGTGGAARVTVGKYVGRNIYLSYTQSIASEMQPAFSLEYYLNQRNELLAERSADGSYSVLWRLKLKY